MKILGLLPGAAYNVCGAIVELSGLELRVICGGISQDIAIGSMVEITNRFDHAQDILAAAKEAKKLPGVLRALADTLEITHPAIEDIIEPVIDASFEVTE